ncbi:hypothetical protein PET01_21630 [Pediococcus ethanolidurans]|uniref:Uncharacterized protein n=1 Tax=Pediococcus ethanolidurans TaxID=319653 RepID=A0A1H9KKC4_9LACO|nr:hypothetical protein PET01_21630 [Pediococcus ethanolidurans]SEQ99552.1 hypothetical protein SAMN04487973_1014 [Pediococcus ethanolidurans]
MSVTLINPNTDYLEFSGIICAEAYILKANGTSLSILTLNLTMRPLKCVLNY